MADAGKFLAIAIARIDGRERSCRIFFLYSSHDLRFFPCEPSLLFEFGAS
jgi:hypothetical protein